jgi:hypothetical protein
MPDYAVRISRTIVETIEWIVPGADETVARRHAEEYLPLIQDDPEFLAGYQKRSHGYDWLIVRVEETRGEEAGKR